MNIAVYAGSLLSPISENNENQIAEILFQLSMQKREHKFFFISNLDSIGKFSSSPNIEVINPEIGGGSGIINKYLWKIKISKILKKVKAEIIISYNWFLAVSLKIPQILFITEGSKVNRSSLKKAYLIAATSQEQKNNLVKKFKIKEEKIVPVYGFANEYFKPIIESVKEKVKGKYTEGKEYFLLPGKNIKDEIFLNLLKSFSLFKKRQQSGMKLMILGSPDKKSLKNLLSYKHRHDIVIIEKVSLPEEAAITGSSYAVIILRSVTHPVLNTLNAFQSKIPVIAFTYPSIRELGKEAVLYIESESVKELGDKMIRIYTDEKLRDQQIQTGEAVIKNFSAQNTADLLWSCIEKVVK